MQQGKVKDFSLAAWAATRPLFIRLAPADRPKAWLPGNLPRRPAQLASGSVTRPRKANSAHPTQVTKGAQIAEHPNPDRTWPRGFSLAGAYNKVSANLPYPHRPPQAPDTKTSPHSNTSGGDVKNLEESRQLERFPYSSCLSAPPIGLPRPRPRYRALADMRSRRRVAQGQCPPSANARPFDQDPF